MKRDLSQVTLTAEETRAFAAQRRFIREQAAAGMEPPAPPQMVRAELTPVGRLLIDAGDGPPVDIVPRSAIQVDKSYSAALATHRDPDLRDLAATLDRELPKGRKPLPVAAEFFKGRLNAKQLAKRSLAKIRAAVSRYRRKPR